MTRKAFILATGADTGGAAIRVVEAFKRCGPIDITTFGDDEPRYLNDWLVHSMVANTNYIEYDQDVPWTRAGLEAYYDFADVVVLNNTLAGHHFYDGGQGKPTILMHHGLHEGHFSQSIEQCVAEAREIGASQICSTVNLELYGNPGEITWAPIPYPLETLRKQRKSLFEPSDTLRIGHAPTDRSVKSTDRIIDAVLTLKNRGFPVSLVLIERQTHDKTLEIKAKYVDIYVDQLKLGYGCNAIEAWAMGIPVIAGVSQYPAWREHMEVRFGRIDMPFYEANEENLVERLAQVVESSNLRDQLVKDGDRHAQRFHSEPAVVGLLSKVYDAASERPTKSQPYGGLRSRRTDRTVRGMNHDQRLALLRANEAERQANKPRSY